MKHVLSGHFGQADLAGIIVGVDERLTNFDLLVEDGGFGNGIGRALDDLHSLGLYPTDAGVDLFLMAVLVYAADTRISRKSESQDSWTREIRIVVPVSDVQPFDAAKSTLEKLLNFLSGDLWSLEFRVRPDEFRNMVGAAPVGLAAAPFDGVSLFSGGMDSLIGSIEELESGVRPLFVGHAGDAATSQAQSAIVEGLREAYPDSEFGYFRLWLQIKKGLIEGVRGEDTTRSRSFLFIAAAMMAGSGLGKPFRLRVPENGLIALNIPLDPTRVGSLSTRTTHPFYLARWMEVAEVLRIRAIIENPYWRATKGEMVENCTNHELLLSLLPSSMSCSSPAKGRWQKLGIQHCGYCLPCIIRRASILRGLGNAALDPTTYTLADLTGVLNTRKSFGKQARSFQVAIVRLKANPNRANFFVLKTGPLSDVSDDHHALAAVYLRGMMEVDKLLENVVTAPL